MGSEILMRVYGGAERRAGRGGLQTHAIKVLNESWQILALQV